jgi:predicted metal-binding membrane protein
MVDLASENRRERLIFVLLFATSGLAWFALWHWGGTPNGPQVHHAHFGEAGRSGFVSEALVFIAGWIVMTVAMMLPTSAPLVALFERFVRARPARPVLVGILIAGYLAVWLLVGVAAFAVVTLLREISARAADPVRTGWIIGCGALLVAGTYQFSSLKYRCLDRCRSPFSFLVEHWTGRRPYRDALRLGVRHGWFCAGCCWALMLLMIPFGAGNLGWMLALGAIMGAEKNFPWGRQVAKPVGVILLLLASILAVWHPNGSH